jgi:hypothetical protein
LDCETFEASLTALIEGCLEEGEHVGLEAHAAVCDSCARLLTTQLTLKQAVSGLAVDAPATLRRSVISGTGRPRRSRAAARRTAVSRMIGRPVAWVGAAAALALIGTTFLLNRQEEPHRFEGALSTIFEHYEERWAGLHSGVTPPGVPDLSDRRLDRWATANLAIPDGRAEVLQYSGSAGKVAVYRTTRPIPLPGNAAAISLPGGEGFQLSDAEYDTLMWRDRSGTTVAIGTIGKKALLDLVPLFRE